MSTDTTKDTTKAMTMDLKGTLAAKVAQLREARITARKVDSTWRDVLAAFDAQHATTEKAVYAANDIVQKLEAEVRAYTLLVWDAAGRTDTKPLAGVQVVMGREVKIDEVEAMQWARQTGLGMKPATLDVAAIKKLADTGVVNMPFVTVIERPSVRIATDLAAAVAP